MKVFCARKKSCPFGSETEKNPVDQRKTHGTRDSSARRGKNPHPQQRTVFGL